MRVLLGAVALLTTLTTQANADFVLRFDAQNTSAVIGQSVNVNVLLEEGAGSSFFTENLTGAAFSFVNSDASVADVSFAANPVFDLPGSSGNVNQSGGSFIAGTFGAGLSGASRQLGVLTFTAKADGTTDFRLDFSPTMNAPELAFQTQFADFNPTGGGGVGSTFQVGTFTAVPEPSAMLLCSTAGLLVLGRRRRSQNSR